MDELSLCTQENYDHAIFGLASNNIYKDSFILSFPIELASTKALI
jgi:hypothetical protein